MPAIIINVNLEGEFPTGETSKKMNICSKNKNKTTIIKGQEYTVLVETRRKSRLQGLKVHCPRYHRSKDEGWFLILGDMKQQELLALKRISGVNDFKKTHYLQFTAPENPGN